MGRPRKCLENLRSGGRTATSVSGSKFAYEISNLGACQQRCTLQEPPSTWAESTAMISAFSHGATEPRSLPAKTHSVNAMACSKDNFRRQRQQWPSAVCRDQTHTKPSSTFVQFQPKTACRRRSYHLSTLQPRDRRQSFGYRTRGNISRKGRSMFRKHTGK